MCLGARNNKALAFSTVGAFQRRRIEGMKKGRRREVCREVTEGLPKGRWGEGEKMGWLLVFHNGFHLVDDLAAAVAGHLGVHADGDHVFVGGETTEVDGGGVLAEGLVIVRS